MNVGEIAEVLSEYDAETELKLSVFDMDEAGNPIEGSEKFVNIVSVSEDQDDEEGDTILVVRPE